MADAHASGACIRTGVRVQIPFSASYLVSEPLMKGGFCFYG